MAPSSPPGFLRFVHGLDLAMAAMFPPWTGDVPVVYLPGRAMDHEATKLPVGRFGSEQGNCVIRRSPKPGNRSFLRTGENPRPSAGASTWGFMSEDRHSPLPHMSQSATALS
jgi:hypothetical protein